MTATIHAPSGQEYPITFKAQDDTREGHWHDLATEHGGDVYGIHAPYVLIIRSENRPGAPSAHRTAARHYGHPHRAAIVADGTGLYVTAWTRKAPRRG